MTEQLDGKMYKCSLCGTIITINKHSVILSVMMNDNIRCPVCVGHKMEPYEQ